MDDDDDLDIKESDSKLSTVAAIAVLQARVKMLTWLFKNELITKHQFEPVKLISYGFATIVISSVLIAVLSYVLRKG